MTNIIKKSISLLICIMMIISACSLSFAVEPSLNGGHVPGQLKVVLKDWVRQTKWELEQYPQYVFMDIKVLSIKDLTDVSSILPPGFEPKPPNSPQSLLIELAIKGDGYLQEALKILEKDPRVAWVGLNGVTSIAASF